MHDTRDEDQVARAVAADQGPATHHGNAFGFLRLVMASAVIVSHAAVLLDGTARREPFAMLFGNTTLGETAVDGFFAISGFLIAGSFLATGNVRAYLLKRIARIYPAFILASLLCIFVVAPLGGADLRAMPPFEWLGAVKRLMLLAVPVVDTFHGLPYAMVNGSMWTILYEFRCYLLLIPLGLLGFLNRPWVLAGIAATLLLLGTFAHSLIAPLDTLPFHSVWFGDAFSGTRLYGVFLAGSAFRAFGSRIRYTKIGLAIAAVLLAIAFAVQPFANIGFALFGTYFVLGIAFLGQGTVLERINNRNDISYGVYLYAWPLTNLFIWYWRDIPLGVLIALTFLGSCACGWLSWHSVEKPVLEWARVRAKRWARVA